MHKSRLIKSRIIFFALLAVVSTPTGARAASGYDAIKHALEQVRRSPADPKLQVNLALAYQSHHDSASAEAALRKALNLPGGKTADNYDMLFQVLSIEGDHQQYCPVAAEFCKAYPHDPRALCDRASANFDISNFDTIPADCTAALKYLAPGNNHFRGEALRIRGQVYFATKKWAAAAQDFGRCLPICPDRESFLRCNRGQCYFKLGRAKEALEEMQKTIAIDPKDDMPYVYRSEYYEGLHQYDKAITDLSTAIHLERGVDKASYERRIKLYVLNNQKALAAKDQATLKDWDVDVKDVFRPLR